MKDNIKFDMEAAVKALREGKDLSGQDGSHPADQTAH